MAQSSPFRAIGLKGMKSSRGAFQSCPVFGTDLISAHFSLLGWILCGLNGCKAKKKQPSVFGVNTLMKMISGLL